MKRLARLLVEYRAWWLGTIGALLVLLALLLFLTAGTSLAPFIYALF